MIFGDLEYGLYLFNILTWDIFNIRNMIIRTTTKELPLRYKGHTDYKRVLLPLALEECRASIERGCMTCRLEGKPIRFYGRGGDCLFIKSPFFLRTKSDNYVGHTPNLKRTKDEFLFADLVLLVPDTHKGDARAFQKKTVFEVRRPRSYQVGMITRIPGREPIPALQIPRVFDTDMHIGRVHPEYMHGNWRCYTIGSLLTSLREIDAALTPRSSLLPFIFQPSAAKPCDAIMSSVHCKQYCDLIAGRADLNESQLESLRHALTDRSGITLLQGPPGTGKTKTLLAIVSVLYDYNKRYAISPKKILVCAPSNAAVDEIASRVMSEGLPGYKTKLCGVSSKQVYPMCVRVGHPSRVTRKDVQPIASFYLESPKAFAGSLLASGEPYDMVKEKLEAEIGKHNERVRMSVNAITENIQIDQDAAGLKKRSKKLSKTLLRYRSGGKDVIKSADIIFATLSGSANKSLRGLNFSCVIVDEASQAVELSTIVPLQAGIKNMILIGDQKQLPATVLSNAARKVDYDRSLFERLQLCGVRVKMLEKQYRMRPAISRFPSAQFYNNKVQDDVSVKSRPKDIFHDLFGVLKFFDIPDSSHHRDRVTKSLSNVKEAMFVANIMKLLMKYVVHTPAPEEKEVEKGCDEKDTKEENCENNVPSKAEDDPSTAVTKKQKKPQQGLVDMTTEEAKRLIKEYGLLLSDIGIVTPYKQQVTEIRKAVEKLTGGCEVEISTVDSFQGREKRIIIMSCVRATDNEKTTSEGELIHDGINDIRDKLGFVADVRRLNVAITRAKDALWVVGHAATLEASPDWREFIRMAKSPDVQSAATRIFENVEPLSDAKRVDNEVMSGLSGQSSVLTGSTAASTNSLCSMELEANTDFLSVASDLNVFFNSAENDFLEEWPALIKRHPNLSG
eukprot:Lankesteria_metandrocarpae@DN5451_c1_g1_i14.p1